MTVYLEVGHIFGGNFLGSNSHPQQLRLVHLHMNSFKAFTVQVQLLWVREGD